MYCLVGFVGASSDPREHSLHPLTLHSLAPSHTVLDRDVATYANTGALGPRWACTESIIHACVKGKGETAATTSHRANPIYRSDFSPKSRIVFCFTRKLTMAGLLFSVLARTSLMHLLARRLWCEERDDPLAWTATTEALENFVFRKLFFHLQNDAVEDARDLELSRHAENLSWLGSEHLSVDWAGHDCGGDWEAAVGSINKLPTTRTPLEKESAFMGCFEQISAALGAIFERMRGEGRGEEEGEKGGAGDGEGEGAGRSARLPTADDVLPAVILVLLRASPKKNICADIEFIRRYRRPRRLHAEVQYFLVTLQSAVEWICSMEGVREMTPAGERGLRGGAIGIAGPQTLPFCHAQSLMISIGSRAWRDGKTRVQSLHRISHGARRVLVRPLWARPTPRTLPHPVTSFTGPREQGGWSPPSGSHRHSATRAPPPRQSPDPPPVAPPTRSRRCPGCNSIAPRRR